MSQSSAIRRIPWCFMRPMIFWHNARPSVSSSKMSPLMEHSEPWEYEVVRVPPKDTDFRRLLDEEEDDNDVEERRGELNPNPLLSPSSTPSA